MIGFGLAITYTRHRNAPPRVPLQFLSAFWQLADSPSAAGDRVSVSVKGLPYSGGGPLDAIEVQVDSGSGYGMPQSLGLSGPGTVTLTVLAGVAARVQIRAVNAMGAGPWSPAQVVTPSTLAPQTPVTAIAEAGWQATYPAPPTLDPVAAPEVLAVRRQGFDATGQPVAVDETVTLMARVRLPYPDQATLTADQVALSDFIHAPDAIGGVTNGSTLAYPRPICCWLTPDMGRATGPTYPVRLAVAHAYARQGRPVACVKFIVSDGSATVEQTVSAMTSRAFASGLHMPYFEAALDLSTLAPGALCTVDAVIYPWVGEAYRASVDGAAYPSINFTVLKLLNDRDGSFGTGYAYVDVAGGSDAAGVVSGLAATAASAPFQTVAGAATAIKAFNSAQFGRAEAGGGVIRLQPGTHQHSGFAAAGASACPLVIEAADPAQRAATIYTDGAVSVSGGFPGKVTLRNLTLRKGGAATVFLDTGAGPTTMDRQMVFEAVAFDRNGQASYGAWLYRPGRCWMVDCTGDPAAALGIYGNVVKEIVLIGCNFPGQTATAVYNALASRLSWACDMAPTTAMEMPQGQMFHHCFLSQTSTAMKAFLVNNAVGPAGLALAGCVLEATAGATSPALSFSADSVTAPVQNVLCIGNTVVGARSNWLYNETGSVAVAKTGWQRFNVHTDHNTKTDIFGLNGALTGNWPAVHNVGSRANVALQGDSAGKSACGVGVWLGEVAALGDVSGSDVAPVVADWVNDQSFAGGKGGQGDYTPGALNALPRIPAGLAPYPVDQAGRSLDDAGAACVGALQMA
ncbi:MAG: hypothetical protein KGN33_12080 [Paracoccaceae bacterium]|nr:hypothetical protein [Paracoccaceae bacterium]